MLLDFVGDRELSLRARGELGHGLWSRLRAAARRVGVGRAFPDETQGIVYDDHTPFVNAGVPAIDLIDFDYACFHKTCDDLRHVSARSLDAPARPCWSWCAAGLGASPRTLQPMANAPEKLLLAAPRGYCAGVDRAVQTVERALEIYGAPVYVRKEIVHNKHVVEQLRERGAIFVEEETEVPEGSTVVFSAHGVAPSVHANARERNLFAIDATCPLVTKVHVEAKKFAAEGYTIVLIGHAGHEEVEGTMGEAPEHIVLIETEEDVEALEVEDPERLAYISQTTLSVDETRAIINRLRERFPSIVGPRTDDICYATTNRQAAVKQMATECDLVLVIGSSNSSNSNRLVEVAREYGAESHLIDNEAQVQEDWLADKRVVGITSGASAPEELVQRLVEFFRDRGTDRRGRVRGRSGGRALHAAEDDPPGDGGTVDTRNPR